MNFQYPPKEKGFYLTEEALRVLLINAAAKGMSHFPAICDYATEVIKELRDNGV